MSAIRQVFSHFGSQFSALDSCRTQPFVAMARVPVGMADPFDETFRREFFKLADSLRPDEVVSRSGIWVTPSGETQAWTYPGPLSLTLFLGAVKEEWVLWEEPGPGGPMGRVDPPNFHQFQRACDLGAPAWHALPNGLKDYRPLHSLGTDWRPWQPQPAWQWVNFVFRQLHTRGDLVGHANLGHIGLLYLRASVFRASALVAGCVAREQGCQESPYAAILAWAEDQLKGAERKAVELVCGGDPERGCQPGEYPLADLALVMEWGREYKNAWDGLVGRLNRKLVAHGYKLHRSGNRAKLAMLIPDASN